MPGGSGAEKKADLLMSSTGQAEMGDDTCGMATPDVLGLLHPWVWRLGADGAEGAGESPLGLQINGVLGDAGEEGPRPHVVLTGGGEAVRRESGSGGEAVRREIGGVARWNGLLSSPQACSTNCITSSKDKAIEDVTWTVSPREVGPDSGQLVPVFATCGVEDSDNLKHSCSKAGVVAAARDPVGGVGRCLGFSARLTLSVSFDCGIITWL